MARSSEHAGDRSVGGLRRSGGVALDANDLVEAKRIAEQLTQIAGRRRGLGLLVAVDAQFNLDVLLGRIALREDRIEDAKAALLRAGSTPGSPSLNSFGPDMSLALELVERGEADVVLQYLGQCELFWKDRGKLIPRWREEVANGIVPDFRPLLLTTKRQD